MSRIGGSCLARRRSTLTRSVSEGGYDARAQTLFGHGLQRNSVSRLADGSGTSTPRQTLAPIVCRVARETLVMANGARPPEGLILAWPLHCQVTRCARTMRYQALACDYDGTLAQDGRVLARQIF